MQFLFGAEAFNLTFVYNVYSLSMGQVSKKLEESEVATTNVELLLEEDPGIAGLYLFLHAFVKWDFIFNTNYNLNTWAVILILSKQR